MIRKVALGLTAVVLGAVAGCMVGPDYKKPEMKVPEGFSAATQPVATQPSTTQASEVAATQPVDIVRWWDTFEDPHLTSLIDRATKANLDVKLAQARVRQARALLEYNWGSLFPMANAGASYTRSQASQNAVGVNVGSAPSGGGGSGGGSGSGGGAAPSFSVGRTDFYQAGFDAGWEIDVFGGTRRAIEAAQYGLDAQVEARRNALVTLLSEVARNYIILRGQQHELAIVQSNLDSQVDTLKLTKSKFEAGIATDLDVARQEAQVEATRSTVPNIQTQIQQSIHRLSVLLDQPPAALEEELAAMGRLPAGPEIIPPGLPSELIRRRPDVRQAERQLAQATANIGVAVADLFPKFNLTGNLGLESLSLKSFANSNSVAWSFGPSVSWKIFSAGQIQANIRVQNAIQEQALIQYRQSVLQAMEDVENALVGYNQEQARRQSLRRAVDSNRRATDLARQLNQAGVVDFLNVLQAQQSQFLSEDQLAQSDQNVATNLIALYKALGGGWEVTDPYAGEKGEQASAK